MHFDHFQNYYKKMEEINTFSELQLATIEFLNGELGELPTYHGPANEETKIIKDKLIAINDCGLVTTCSEPFRHYVNEDGVKYRQRPYIELFIPREIFDEFSSNLLEVNESVAIIKSDPTSGVCTVYCNINFAKLSVWAPDNEDTRGIYMTMHQAEIDGKWVEDPKHETNMHFDYNDMLFCYKRKLREELEDNYFFCNIFSDQFNNDLFDDIISSI